MGGYGRRELAPHSDLDVVLLHDDAVDPGELAALVWYPLWDGGRAIDHAVRGLGEAVTAASEDLRVMLGMLDLRHVAGDPNLTLRLRTAALAAWRREARTRIPELHRLVLDRHRRCGELGHASVPDLKESAGGLRDAQVLRALVATWLVDVPHQDLERSRQVLLDVRDALHDLHGRGSDRVGPDTWEDLAAGVGAVDAHEAQVRVRRAGRRLAHISRLTWQRTEALLDRPRTRRGPRGPRLDPVAPGVAVAGGEVVPDRTARPREDPLLLLRAAAEAAERGLVLPPGTAARLARDGARLPTLWPDEARRLLVRLLAAGPGLLPVWETLDETGAIDTVLPEWEDIRLLPHASVIHRFTVDRHVVETCIEASRLVRQVARPDLLLLAALLHDIGKARLGDHSVVGEPVARAVAERIGLPPADADLVGRLVRHHLLLARTATTRDPADPATAVAVAGVVPSVDALDLLHALTEADARATSAQAWSQWRAGLVRRLVARTRAVLVGPAGPDPALGPPEGAVAVPAEVLRGASPVAVTVAAATDGSRVTVVAPDRIGLLADVAATLALQRVPVRAARAWAQGDIGVSEWEVADGHLDAAVLRQRLLALAGGAPRPDPALVEGRPSRRPVLEPVVVVRPDASATATVLEVRVDDRPGVVHLVCAALAGMDLSVRSAHVSTVGPQAVDVFYVQEPGAGPLSETRAASAAHAVRGTLLVAVDR